MALDTNRKSIARRIRDRLFQRSARRFRYTLDPGERTLLVRMDIIARCNMRCFMCPYPGIHDSGRAVDVMTPDLFRRIADQVFPYAYHVALSCAYEPLMHPRLEEILAIGADYDLPEWGFVTNGSLLTERVIDAMIRSRMRVLSVSIDAATPQTYRAIRGVDAFDRVIANVRALQARKAAKASELPHLLSNFVLTRMNLDEALAYLELCRELGVEDVTFVHMMPRSLENEQSLLHEPEKYAGIYREARAFAERHAMRVVLPAPFTEAELAGDTERRLQQTRAEDVQVTGATSTSVPIENAGDDIYCASPWMMLFISPNGDVHPCSHRQYDAPFGNLASMSFDEIWNGPAYLELRRQLARSDLRDRCRVCQAATPNSEPMVRRPIRILEK